MERIMSLNEASKREVLTELEQFLNQFVRYREFVLMPEEKRVAANVEGEFQMLRLELQRKYGSLKEVIKKYGSPTRVLLESGKYECEAFTSAFGSYKVFGPGALEVVVDTAIAAVNTAIGNLQSPMSLESVTTVTILASPKAFIAHGGESPAREKLVNFLNALGITPIIVEEQPSEGRSKDKNVEHYLKQCDCAIILATKGDVDGQTGEFIPRGNILNEIGRAQEILPDKMIYLLEEETKFPTNIDEKVWERFTQESMDKAFIKITKELRAFELIKTV
jgi:predicted nucleotide-binding protein